VPTYIFSAAHDYLADPQVRRCILWCIVVVNVDQ